MHLGATPIYSPFRPQCNFMVFIFKRQPALELFFRGTHIRIYTVLNFLEEICFFFVIQKKDVREQINHSHSTIIAFCAIDLTLWSVSIDLAYTNPLPYKISFLLSQSDILKPLCTSNYIHRLQMHSAFLLATVKYGFIKIPTAIESLKCITANSLTSKYCLWQSYDTHSQETSSTNSLEGLQLEEKDVSTWWEVVHMYFEFCPRALQKYAALHGHCTCTCMYSSSLFHLFPINFQPWNFRGNAFLRQAPTVCVKIFLWNLYAHSQKILIVVSIDLLTGLCDVKCIVYFKMFACGIHVHCMFWIWFIPVLYLYCMCARTAPKIAGGNSCRIRTTRRRIEVRKMLHPSLPSSLSQFPLLPSLSLSVCLSLCLSVSVSLSLSLSLSLLPGWKGKNVLNWRMRWLFTKRRWRQRTTLS